MADPNPTEILLKVVANADDLKKLQEGFKTSQQVILSTSNEAEKLGLMLRQATELGGIKQLVQGIAQVHAETAKATAEERRLAEERRKAAAVAADARKVQREAAAAIRDSERAAANEASRLAAEARRAAAALKDGEKASEGMAEWLKRGFGFVGGMALANTAKSAIVGLFRESVTEGVRFNAVLETSALGVASVLKTFNPEKYRTFNDAIRESASLIEDLKKKALESPATFEELLQAYQGSAGAMTAANIPMGKQVDLIANISQAMVALGIHTQEMRQETTALMMGRIDRNARLAQTLGITNEDVTKAKEQGRLFEFLSEKMREFAEAGKIGTQTIQVLKSNLSDARTQVAADSTKDLAEAYRQLLMSMTDLVKSEAFRETLKFLSSMTKGAFDVAGSFADVFSNGRRQVADGGMGTLLGARSAADAAAARRQALTDRGMLERMQADELKQGIMPGKFEEDRRAALRKQISQTLIATAPGAPGAAAIITRNTSADSSESASAKASMEMKNAQTFMEEYVKEMKVGTAEHERQQRIIEASAGSSRGMLDALRENEASVKRQHDLLREKFQFAKDDDQLARWSAAVQQSEEEELGKIQKQRLTVVAKMNRDEFQFFQEKARYGTAAEQIASKQALIAQVQADATKDEWQKKTDILRIEREIASLKDREHAKALAQASELQQRTQAARLGAIRQNPYLTQKQKDAMLNSALRQEAGQLPGQISAAESSASAAPYGSAEQSHFQNEAKRLRERGATIGNDITATNPTTNMQDMQQGLVRLMDSFKSMGELISDGIGGAFSSINQELTNAIVRTGDWASAFNNVALTIGTSVVGALIQMSTQWIARKIIEFTVGSSLRAAAFAANAATATALSALWAPAATLATIASFGGAAVQAPISIGGAMASVQGMAAIPGFADGGVVTGPGGPREDNILSRLSAGEIVFSNRDIARLGGAAAVEALRVNGGVSGAGAGVSAAPSVGGAGGPAVGGGGDGVNIAYFNTKQDAETWLSSQSGRRTMIDFIRGQKFDLA